MIKPVFKLQIVYEDGKHVPFAAGGQLERDLVQAITTEIMSRGVGFFKTEAMVRKAVEEGIEKVLYDLKRATVPYVR